MRPSGKPERLQPSAAFYFTDKPPARTPVKFGLWSYDIDLPAGEKAVVVRDSITLPLDLDLLRVLPHAHFLGRRLEGTAKLPDGSTRCLLRIDAWDFNWQGDYAYKNPVFLPKGTVVTMEFTYDNSEGNPRNPRRPPRRVRFGLQSDDEMAELWFQALPHRAGEVKLLDDAMRGKVLQAGLSYNRYLLTVDPGNAKAHADLGKAHLLLGRPDEALPALASAIRLRPDFDEPHYFLGLLHRTQNRPGEAKAEFQAAIRANPGHAKAHGNLGLLLMEEGRLDAAAREFETALRLNPADEIARESLEEIKRAGRKKE
ncbi:MAG: tetratricopeptide repeat protein [Planctomycetes bacterium]|nr:tetratricopeptide repeat protein [Planctomycetota bacterium]